VPNIHPFAANGHFRLYDRPFSSLSSCAMAYLSDDTLWMIDRE